MTKLDYEPPASEGALLEAFLRGRSQACPVCGYDLRDLRTGCCPECGRALQLTVAERRQVHAPFVVGVIALAAPVGASATGLVGAAYYGIVRAYGWDLVAGGLAVNGVVFALSATALALWLRNARAIKHQPLSRQWAFAAAAWAATLIGCGVCLAIG